MVNCSRLAFVCVGGGWGLWGLNNNRSDWFGSDFSGAPSRGKNWFELNEGPPIPQRKVNNVRDLSYRGFHPDNRLWKVRKIFSLWMNFCHSPHEAPTDLNVWLSQLLKVNPVIDIQPSKTTTDESNIFTSGTHLFRETTQPWDWIYPKATTKSDCKDKLQKNTALPSPKGLRVGVKGREIISIDVGAQLLDTY